MKELKQLENRLRSWTPRRPSASIKQRLFPQAAQAAAATVEIELPNPINWRWLVPAMALCIATLIVLARSASSGLGESSYRLAPTFALSNLDFASAHRDAISGEIPGPEGKAGLKEFSAVIKLQQFQRGMRELATYYAAAPQNDRNTLPVAKFEWTNGAHSSTTPPSFLDRTAYRE